MLRIPNESPDYRHRFRRQVMAPIGALMAAAIGLGIFSLYYTFDLLDPPILCTIAIMVLAMVLLAASLWRSGSRLAQTVVELVESRARAEQLAYRDVLTGLSNRAMFESRLGAALANTQGDPKIALLLLDLDNFKRVNDTLGHIAGDALIREFSNRLAAVVRSTDSVSRIGGDEFTVLLCGIDGTEQVDALCARIFAAVRRPFDILGVRVTVDVSIGIALASDGDSDGGELMRRADIALYRAKDEGRHCHRYFTDAMDRAVKLRGQMEEELRRALASGDELKVCYQPEIGARSGLMVGLEALVRWQHPMRGLISPDEFIPVAEDSGLICQLGEWVLGEACRTALQWPGLFMAVNLSPVQFRCPDFAARVIAIVAASGCDPRRIELEVTETALIEDEESCCAALDRLRRHGFRIALDDFGTGYSSLSYLRRFHVDKIKIDRSFTHSIDESLDAGAIVTAIVTLGHAMGITVAAEGIETRDQLAFLTAAGCDEFQGFLFSRPVPQKDIFGLMHSAPEAVEVQANGSGAKIKGIRSRFQFHQVHDMRRRAARRRALG